LSIDQGVEAGAGHTEPARDLLPAQAVGDDPIVKLHHARGRISITFSITRGLLFIGGGS
jgi:hypothetical protein